MTTCRPTPPRSPRRLAAGLALCALLAAAPAMAQSATDIIRSLAPIAPHSIGTGGYGRPVPIDRSGTPATVVIDTRYVFEQTVYFRYDSAELTERARTQLTALGRALQSPRLKPYRYLIAGHTDAVGSPDYNRDLSLRRAVAVARYLVARFGIEPRRIEVAGFGATRLKDPRNPLGAVNRRVEAALIADAISPPPPMSGIPPPGRPVAVPVPAGAPVIIHAPPGSSVNVRIEGDGPAAASAAPPAAPAARPCAIGDMAACESGSGRRIIINE